MSSALLAIETSTPQGSVAVVREGVVIYQQSFSSERSHNSQLFAPLREALDLVGSEGLRAVVVGTGPASYTGVRIGIAAAQGIALARTVPVFGLASVLGIADEEEYFVCGDARRGTFFLAHVQGGKMVSGVQTMDAVGLREQHGQRGGTAPWFTFDGKSPLELAGVQRVSPSAVPLALLAEKMSAAELELKQREVLEPVYLSAPFVTMPGK